MACPLRTVPLHTLFLSQSVQDYVVHCSLAELRPHMSLMEKSFESKILEKAEIAFRRIDEMDRDHRTMCYSLHDARGISFERLVRELQVEHLYLVA